MTAHDDEQYWTAVDQLCTLAGLDPPHRYAKARVSVIVDWTDAATARSIVTTAGLTVTDEEASFLNIGRPHGRQVLISTTVPNRELAIILATAADATDTALRTAAPAATEPGDLPVSSLADLIADNLTLRPDGTIAGDQLFTAVHRALQGRTLGQASDPATLPVHVDTLATLLLGNAGVTAEYPDDGTSVLDALIRALERTPNLVDVARALETDRTPDTRRGHQGSAVTDPGPAAVLRVTTPRAATGRSLA